MTPPPGDRSGAVDGRQILANARAASATLRAEADEAERRRQLTPRAVEAMRSMGAFRMPMPRSWGGPEVDICTQVEILEELSAADGSAGWCAMVGCEAGWFSAALDDGVARELFSGLDAIVAGSAPPTGKLHRVPGGYRLEGTWRFGSGCTHADVVYGGAVVHEGGRPALVGGRPDVRYPLVPAAAVDVLDTWHTTGLAGTGSHDYAVAGTFVPAAHTFRLSELRHRRREGALYAWPGLLGAKAAGVPLGIARAALGAAEEALDGRTVGPADRPAREDGRVRSDFARAQALVGSARSYAFDLLGVLWATLEAGAEPSLRQRAALGGMQVHTVRTCLEAVRILVDLLGSAAIYRRCPVERHARDLATLSQHTLGQVRRMELVGALWLGVDGVIDEHPVTREGFL